MIKEDNRLSCKEAKICVPISNFKKRRKGYLKVHRVSQNMPKRGDQTNNLGQIFVVQFVKYTIFQFSWETEGEAGWGCQLYQGERSLYDESW